MGTPVVQRPAATQRPTHAHIDGILLSLRTTSRSSLDPHVWLRRKRPVPGQPTVEAQHEVEPPATVQAHEAPTLGAWVRVVGRLGEAPAPCQ